MTQVINQITMLTVILTGAALIREREQGTVEHLLVMPIVAPEIMVAKMIANALVILVAATLSIQFVVHWWIGSPINGSLVLFVFGAAIYALVVAALGIMLGTLATTMGQFGLLAIPVLMVTQLLSGSSTPMESMPVWLQYVVQTVSPTPHFVSFAQAVLFRGADVTLVWRSFWRWSRSAQSITRSHSAGSGASSSAAEPVGKAGQKMPRGSAHAALVGATRLAAPTRTAGPCGPAENPLLDCESRGRVRVGQDLLGHAPGAAFRNQPVDEQRRQAVDEAPGGQGRGTVFLPLALRAGNGLLKEIERFVHGFVERRILLAVGQQRPEHQAEQSAFLQREIDVGGADPADRVAAVGRRFQRGRKFAEAFRGDRGEEVLLAGEIPVGGCRRHADPAGGLAQPDAIGAGFVEQRPCGGPHGVRQISVSVRARSRNLFHRRSFGL